MKNRKNLLLVVLLLVVVAVATASTYAWLTDTESSGDLSYEVGEVAYDVASTLTSADTVVPGQELGNFTITNKSNVKTHVRVSFSVSVELADGTTPTWTVGTKEDSDHILLKQTDSKWELTDGYYYYGDGVADTKGSADILPVTAGASVSLDPLFNSIVINGKIVGNEAAGATINIKITFYAKQAEYVTWENIGSIDWTKGI